MSIITISRGSYSRGKEVAEKVAQRLGYTCIARDVLMEASQDFNIPEIKLVRAIHDAPSILDRLGYRKEKYDIAVLDVKMPSMSGIDLKNKIEKIAPGMKFIFITGHGSEQDYDIVCREAVCCIIKPFKIEALVEKIEQALNT